MAFTLNRRLSTLVDSSGQLNTGKIPNDYITSDHVADNSITTAMLHTGFTLPTSSLSSIDTDDVTEGSTNLFYTTARVDSHLSGGTGVTYSSGTISIGQAVATSSNVTFASVSASSAHIDGITYADSGIHGNLKVSGSLTTTGNASIAGDLIVSGTLTAQEIHTEFVSASVIFSSGSTKFGDTLDDTHTFTGSVALTGSLVLNGYSVTEISNDATLADNSATALVTENAVSNYTSTVINTEQTYLRKSYVKTSTSISATTASFTAVTASAPVTMTGTTEDDFIFFINGQYMEHDALTIRQAGSTFQLHVDTGSIGYVLESDDEIFAYGKFNS